MTRTDSRQNGQYEQPDDAPSAMLFAGDNLADGPTAAAFSGETGSTSRGDRIGAQWDKPVRRLPATAPLTPAIDSKNVDDVGDPSETYRTQPRSSARWWCGVVCTVVSDE